MATLNLSPPVNPRPGSLAHRLSLMQLGESFIVPTSIAAVAAMNRARAVGVLISTRKEPEGWRVSRVEQRPVRTRKAYVPRVRTTYGLIRKEANRVIDGLSTWTVPLLAAMLKPKFPESSMESIRANILDVVAERGRVFRKANGNAPATWRRRDVPLEGENADVPQG